MVGPSGLGYAGCTVNWSGQQFTQDPKAMPRQSGRVFLTKSLHVAAALGRPPQRLAPTLAFRVTRPLRRRARRTESA